MFDGGTASSAARLAGDAHLEVGEGALAGAADVLAHGGAHRRVQERMDGVVDGVHDEGDGCVQKPRQISLHRHVIRNPGSQVCQIGILSQSNRVVTSQAEGCGQGLVDQRHEQVALEADAGSQRIDALPDRLQLLQRIHHGSQRQFRHPPAH